MKEPTTTEPTANPPRSRLRKLLVWLVCAAILAGVFFLALPKTYGWAKRFQAARLAKMAEGYAADGKMQEAMMSADTALRLDPKQPGALRFMAEIFEADGRSNQAMELYGRLYQSGGGTLEDLKKQALNALRAGYTDPANYWAQLVAEKGEPDFPAVLQAEVKVRSGESAEALGILREAVSHHGGRNSRLALLRLLLAAPNADNRNAEISEQLLKLQDGSDAAALEALSVGVSTDLLPPETRLEWIKQIRQHPIKRLPLLLFTDTTEVQLDPASQLRVAAELVQRVRGRSLQDRLQAAQWLLWKGQPRDALEILPLKDALPRADAMRTWVDLAAAIGEWKTLREALAVPTNPLPGHISKIYTARAFKMSGRDAEGDALYRAALEEYKEKPAESVEMLEYLHRSGEYGLFDASLPYQLAKPGNAMVAMQSLVPVVAEARDSTRLRQLFQMAQDCETLKDNNLILNDAAYLDLVLGRPTDTAALEKRFQEHPSDPAVRFTLALAKLQQGQKLPALTLLQQANIPPQNLPPNQLLILASVLAANNEPEKAIAVARLIPAVKISNQELEILKSHLAK
jgi:thioredoxin-like negative regulator of GroEL